MKLFFGKKGGILVITIWIIMVLGLLSTYYAVDARIRRINANNELSDLQGRLYTRIALIYVSLKLSETKKYFSEISPNAKEIPDNLLIPDGIIREIKVNDEIIKFSIEDERGKIDLNNSSDDELEEIIRLYFQLYHPEIDKKEVEIIIDSILDWKDADSIPRRSGAEDDYYLRMKYPYNAPNRPFKITEEIGLIRGANDILLKDIDIEHDFFSKLFTVYNYHGRVLYHLASPELQEILKRKKQDTKDFDDLEKIIASYRYFDVIKLTVYTSNKNYVLFFRHADDFKAVRVLRWLEFAR